MEIITDMMEYIITPFGFSLEDVQSKSRKAELCDMRKILSYELKNDGFTLKEIGGFLKCDHSTIIRNLQQYEARLIYDKVFKDKVVIVEQRKKHSMKIHLTLDNGKLLVLNNSMQVLDTLNLQSQPKQFKSIISISMELRTELLQKSIKTRQKNSSFTLKLNYHKADALYQYLMEFEILFPDDFGAYEKNALLLMKNELHKQLL